MATSPARALVEHPQRPFSSRPWALARGTWGGDASLVVQSLLRVCRAASDTRGAIALCFKTQEPQLSANAMSADLPLSTAEATATQLLHALSQEDFGAASQLLEKLVVLPTIATPSGATPSGATPLHLAAAAPKASTLFSRAPSRACLAGPFLPAQARTQETQQRPQAPLPPRPPLAAQRGSAGGHGAPRFPRNFRARWRRPSWRR